MTIYGKMIYVIKRSRILQLRQPLEHAACGSRKPFQPRSLPPAPNPCSGNQTDSVIGWGEQGWGLRGRGLPPSEGFCPL